MKKKILYVYSLIHFVHIVGFSMDLVQQSRTSRSQVQFYPKVLFGFLPKNVGGFPTLKLLIFEAPKVPEKIHLNKKNHNRIQEICIDNNLFHN